MDKIKCINGLIKEKKQQYNKKKESYDINIEKLYENYDENKKQIQKLQDLWQIDNKNYMNQIGSLENYLKKIEKPLYLKEFQKVNYNKFMEKEILKKKFYKDSNQVREILRQEWQNEKSICKNQKITLEFERYNQEEGWSFTKETIYKYPINFYPITKDDLNYNPQKKLILYQDIEGLEKNKDWIQKQVKYIQDLKIEDFELLIDYSYDQNEFIGKKNLKKQNRLKKIINNSPPLDYDLIVYRGINNDYFSQQNKYFYNNRFISTTYLLHEAFKFMGSYGCCIVQIYLPKGTRCIFMPILSVYPEENEILLSKDSVFKILKKNMNSVNDTWQYDISSYPFQKKIIKTKIPSNFKSFMYKYLGISL